MQAAADERPGTMAALIGISDDDAEAACQRAEDEVWVANYNAPGQVVIAGTAEGVAAASERAKELGAKRVLAHPGVRRLPHPAHAPGPARLRKMLDGVDFHSPEVPVVANVDARVHTDPGEWPGLLSAQLCSPVRWRQSLETLGGRGVTTIAELGPGGVLTGLVRRTVPDVRGVAVAVPDDLDKLMDTVAGTDEWTATAGHQGEHLYTSERVIVSPAPGVFEPDWALAALERNALAEAGGPRQRPRGPSPVDPARRRRPGGHGRAHRRPHPLRRRSSCAGWPSVANGWSKGSRWPGSAPAAPRRDGSDVTDTAASERAGGPGDRGLAGHRPGLRPVVPGRRRPGGGHLAERQGGRATSGGSRADRFLSLACDVTDPEAGRTLPSPPSRSDGDRSRCWWPTPGSPGTPWSCA